jgi:uroporphyrinogen decarboxylase-like protein
MRREHMQAVFNAKLFKRPPASIRLELWHKEMSLKDSLPEEVKGMSLGAVEDYLGFCRAARYRSNPTVSFGNSIIEKTESATEKIEKYKLGDKGELCRVIAFADSTKSLAGHIIKYPLETENDFDLLLSEMEDAYVDLKIDDFDAFDKSIGNTGLPVLIIGPCPAHHIMLQFCGYEKFFLHMADFPEKVDLLINHFDRIYRRDIWKVVCDSKAELVLHGAHFSSQMTPPPIFKKYFFPYFKEFNDLMHAYSKKVLWHADAEMSNLLDLVLETGFDGADCLASEPIVNQKIEEYFSAWAGNIVCWGGLPSVIFDYSFPFEKYISIVDHLIDVTKGRKDFIFGVSDNIMPGADWKRVSILAEKLKRMED